MTPYSQHIGGKSAEQVQFEPHQTSGSLGAGVLVSVGLHILLIAFIVFGLPGFFSPEPLPAVIGIEFAQQADITASNARIQGPVKKEPPKPAMVAQKAESKKETPPPPPAPQPAAAPPPPAAEEEEVVESLPDPAIEVKKEADKKAAEEKKEKEKKEKEKKEKEKKEKEKKEKEKKEAEELERVLQTLTKQPPAPEPEPDQKAGKKPVEQEPATGQVTQEYSAIPLSAGEKNAIGTAIEKNWIVPTGLPNIETYSIQLRLHMNKNGTISKIEIISPVTDNVSRTIANSAIRAVNKTIQLDGRLPVPADKYDSTMVIRYDMAVVCANIGC